MDLLTKEQDLLGSRYVTRGEVLATCDLVARGEVWPLVTEVRPLAEAEAVHARLERGEVTGRAALASSRLYRSYGFRIVGSGLARRSAGLEIGSCH